MKRAIFSILFTFSVTTGAYAACPWQHVGAVGMDIEQGRDLLKNYGACRTNCKTLQAKLDNSVRKLSQASACGRHIVSAQDKEMIDFISSRSRLIKKQKQGQAWALKSTPTPAAKPIAIPKDDPVMTEAAFVPVAPAANAKPTPATTSAMKPQAMPAPQMAPVASATPQQVRPAVNTAPAVQPQAQTAPVATTAPSRQPQVAQAHSTAPVPQQAVSAKQTKMAISKEAYSALFLENDQAPPRAQQVQRNAAAQQGLTAQQKAQRQAQRDAQIRAKQQANREAKLRQVAKQRADQQRKQALIKRQQLNVIKAKKLAMQKHLMQQRQARLRLQKQRALLAHQNRLRVKQQRLARARRQ